MDAALMSSQLNAVSPMLIMMIGPRPDDMKPGIHCVVRAVAESRRVGVRGCVRV
jgi:hypothetical protein